MPIGSATLEKVNEVVATCERYGTNSIIALAGVPGTGKSFVASIAAQRFAGHATLVQEVQFHPSYTYEEFMEGLRIDRSGGVTIEEGPFLEWNQAALSDPSQRYVLLIEELTRANVPAVIGELMTYVEHRGRPMQTVYSRRPVRVAENLTILATYNPTDRSALELDTALLRRMRILWCSPDLAQLEEMLAGRGLRPEVIDKLKELFEACQRDHEGDYQHLMPFGHGIFAQVNSEAPDLYDLWNDRIRHVLYRPLMEPHPFAETIEAHFPWANDSSYVLP